MATRGAGRYQYSGSTGQTTLTASLGASGGNVTSGSVIVVGVKWHGVDANATVTDNVGNTYTALTKRVHPAVAMRVQLFYVENCIGDADLDVTVTFDTPVDRPAMHWREFLGVATSGSLVEEEYGFSNPATTTVVIGTLNATGAGAFFAIGAHSSTGNFITDPEAVVVYNIPDGSASQDRLISSAGDYITGFGHASNRLMLAAAALFQDTVPVGFTLPAEQGSYSLSGQDAGSALSRAITAERGTYSLTGQDADLFLDSIDTALVAEHGVYNILGSDGYADYEVNAEFDTYNLSGQAANTRRDYRMPAATGVHLLVGYDPNLLYSGSGPKVIVAEHGTYSVAGQANSLRRAAKLVSERGLYSINGFAVVGGASEDTGTGSGGVLKVRRVLVVSTSGRARWVHYIPVKQVADAAGNEGRYDNTGAVEVELIGSGSGLQEWVDYIPVVEVGDGEEYRWRYDNSGWIPIIIVE